MSEENLAASEKELSDAVDEVLSEATVVVDEVATLTAIYNGCRQSMQIIESE